MNRSNCYIYLVNSVFALYSAYLQVGQGWWGVRLGLRNGREHLIGFAKSVLEYDYCLFNISEKFLGFC